MVAHRDHLSAWRTETFLCACGWFGSANAMGSELFEALAVYSCPKCDAHLILVSHPTGEDIKEAAAGGDKEALAMLDAVPRSEHRAAERRRDAPPAPDRLPDLASGGELKPWIDEARATPGFAAFWDEAPAATRAYVLACFALADLGAGSPTDRAQLYAQLITEPRPVVVERLSRGKVPRDAVKTLERCDAANFQRADWTALFAQLGDAKTRRSLSHVTQLTTTLVRQLDAVPSGLRLPAIFVLLTTLAVDAEHWARITHALDQAGPDRRATLLRGARKLETAGELFDLLYRCTDAALAASMARQGPINLGPRFEPIVGGEAMRAEGERMDNCLDRLVERSTRGASAYFAWLGEPRATVELRAVEGNWVLGEIGGPSNRDLDPSTKAAIRAAVSEVLGPQAAGDPKEFFGRLRGAGFAHCAAVGRREFPDTDVAELADDLWSLHGRSLSATQGAYVILDLEDSAYFQCLADRGSTYFIEFSSHRYLPAIANRLTSPMVRLLEDSGFQWPRTKANFSRLFRVESRDDCVELAEFALGALREMFGVQTVGELVRTVRIPSADDPQK